MEDLSAATEAVAPEPIVEAPAGDQTEGQTEGQAAEGEKPEETAEKSEAAKRRERAKAKQAEIKQQRDDALAKLAASEAKLAKIEARLNARKMPSEAEFADPLALTAAQGGWHATREILSLDADEAKEEREAARQQILAVEARRKAEADQNWSDRAMDASTRYADFKEVVAAPGLFPEGAFFVDLVKESDKAGDLAYAIARDRNLHDDLLRMQPVEAARAIGRIEATLTLPKPRTETNAPAPISPVRGSAGASLNPEKLSVEEYIAARKAGKIR